MAGIFSALGGAAVYHAFRQLFGGFGSSQQDTHLALQREKEIELQRMRHTMYSCQCQLNHCMDSMTLYGVYVPMGTAVFIVLLVTLCYLSNRKQKSLKEKIRRLKETHEEEMKEQKASLEDRLQEKEHLERKHAKQKEKSEKAEWTHLTEVKELTTEVQRKEMERVHLGMQLEKQVDELSQIKRAHALELKELSTEIQRLNRERDQLEVKRGAKQAQLKQEIKELQRERDQLERRLEREMQHSKEMDTKGALRED